MSVPIISVTGTKGKTSVLRALSAVLSPYIDHILRVDTEGAWLDGELKLSHTDSKRLWGLAPGNAPGRFITYLAGLKGSAIALLEANVFSSKACGLGYSHHLVGVFTNVYSDHIGADYKLDSEQSIAAAKSFIFSRISKNGYAVYNADDELVLSQVNKISKKKNITKISCSLKGVPSDDADIKIYLESDNVLIEEPSASYKVGPLDSFAAYVPGFEPSIMNIMLTIGALRGYIGQKLDGKIINSLQAYRPNEEDARLIIFNTPQRVKVILDFAHEEESLKAVAKLARQLSKQGRVIGILRLSPTKDAEAIERVAEKIYGSFDRFIVYDKIDGSHRKPDNSLDPFREEKTGYISKLFADSLNEKGANVQRIIDEAGAIARARAIAEANDVIVHIYGNDPKYSLGLLRKNFPGLTRLIDFQESK